MDKLNFLVDGVLVRETDMSKFRTETALRDWRRRVISAYENRSGNSSVSAAGWDVLTDLNEITDPVRAAIRESAENRKMVMPARNLDLVVEMPNDDRDDNMKYAFQTKCVAEVGAALIMFGCAAQMTAYEFDAYDTLGDAECDRQGIETLHDMFGTEWAEAFYRRKNELIALDRLQELYAERNELDRSIAEWEAKLP